MPSFIRVFCPAMLTCLLLAAAPSVGSAWDLTVLHTNDVHSHLLEFDDAGRLCLDDEPQCAGGVARLATVVQAERARGTGVLLVDAGDQFQGSALFTKHRGQAAARFMNLLGYDAMVVGNHEFDLGPKVLAEFAQALSFPLLAANVEVSGLPALSRALLPYAIVVRDGRKIGIIGAVTPETSFLSRPGPDVRFEALAPAVEMAACELRAVGVDVVVCLTHQGYAQDLELAARVPGLDVVVGGHSHTALGEVEGAAGPYPTVVSSPEGLPVLVVSDGKWGRALGVLRVEFDEAGVPVAWSGAPRPLDPEVPRDAETLESVREYVVELKEFLGEPAGSLRAPLTADRTQCRTGECAMGNVVADASLAALGSAGAQLALVNAGSIRTGLPQGPVTQRDVATALPFSNTLVLARLMGSDILAALEHGVGRAASDQSDMGGTGRFLQVAGLRYAWTPDNPPGSRILSVDVRQPEGGYALLESGREYVVVINDFLAAGGDGFAMLQSGARGAYDTSLTQAQALREWLVAHSPLAAGQDGRILTVVAAE